MSSNWSSLSSAIGRAEAAAGVTAPLDAAQATALRRQLAGLREKLDDVIDESTLVKVRA